MSCVRAQIDILDLRVALGDLDPALAALISIRDTVEAAASGSITFPIPDELAGIISTITEVADIVSGIVSGGLTLNVALDAHAQSMAMLGKLGIHFETALTVERCK